MKHMLLVVAVGIASHVDAAAVVVRQSDDTTIIADRKVISAFEGNDRLWQRTVDLDPLDIVVDDTSRRGFLIDPIENAVAPFETETGRFGKTMMLPDTPLQPLAIGDSLYYLSRERGSLVRISARGDSEHLTVGIDPALFRKRGPTLVVYSRIDGRLTVVDRDSFRVLRSSPVLPFASDVELDSSHAYFTFPRSGKVAVYSLAEMKQVALLDVGAVPTDLELVGKENAVSAGELAIADPSSRKVWRQEREQSVASATARGFLRGLIGLGLYAPKAADFPTGVDRLISRNGKLYAFDSATGSLYLVTRSGSKRLLAGIAWRSFDLTKAGEVVRFDGEAPVTLTR